MWKSWETECVCGPEKFYECNFNEKEIREVTDGGSELEAPSALCCHFNSITFVFLER